MTARGKSTGPAHSGTARDSAKAALLLWVSLVLMIVPLLVRASSNLDLFPGWDTDPLTVPHLRGGLTPAGSIVCDAVSLLGSALLLLIAGGTGGRAHAATLVLAAIGSIGVAVHAVGIGPGLGSIGDQRIGLSWLSAIAAGVAVVHAGADARVRRVVVASVLGFVVLLAIRGGHEMLIDHPRTIAEFKRDRDQILTSHDWIADSPMAKSFERRLMQSDVNGWFGLSNVYAALAAAGATAGGGIAVSSIRRRKTPERDSDGAHADRAAVCLVGAAAVACLAGVGMAQSKGGAAMLGVGIGCLAVFVALGKLRGRLGGSGAARLAGSLGVASIAGALALIVVRGLIGERVGELSVYFRWFYAQAALRVFAAHPMFGVGPDGFQRAYLLAKTPLSPEEVSSPHNILLEYLATLGAFGAAFGVLLIVWAWRAGRAGLSGDSQPGEDPGSRDETRVALGIAAACTLTASYIQGAIVTPDLALVRMVGMVAWAAVAWAVLRVIRSGAGCSAALSAAALALLAHAQIDLDLSWPQSCGVVMCMVATAAALRPSEQPQGQDRRKAGLGLTAAAAVCLGTGIAGAIAAERAHRWERALLDAADAARPPADLGVRLAALAEGERGDHPRRESLKAVLDDLGTAVARPVKGEPADIRRAMIELESRVIPRAIPDLGRAAVIDPTDFRPNREAVRLWVRLADAQHALGLDAESRASIDSALRAAEEAHGPESSARHALIAQVRLRRADSHNVPGDRTEAARELDRALGLDPYNLELSLRRYRLAVALNEPAQARAKRCIELDELARLDREVRGLPGPVREELKRASEKP